MPSGAAAEPFNYRTGGLSSKGISVGQEQSYEAISHGLREAR